MLLLTNQCCNKMIFVFFSMKTCQNPKVLNLFFPLTHPSDNLTKPIASFSECFKMNKINRIIKETNYTDV